MIFATSSGLAISLFNCQLVYFALLVNISLVLPLALHLMFYYFKFQHSYVIRS